MHIDTVIMNKCVRPGLCYMAKVDVISICTLQLKNQSVIEMLQNKICHESQSSRLPECD